VKQILLAAALLTSATVHADEQLRRDGMALFGRIEAQAASTPETELGRMLFWDTRLSVNGKIACASCHPARDWGADRRRFSIDARDALTSRHSPSVFNSTMQPTLRWLADRKNAADQAESSIIGSMGFPAKDAIVEVLARADYLPAFRKAYPEDAQPVTPRNYGRAIAAYEATLTTPAPFDRFLLGEDSALSERQKNGMRAFIASGCAGCHSGALLGGTVMQRFGVVKNYWIETGSPKIDEGRYAITTKEEDRYVFRVPMLRNVAKTAPYFHDGSVDRLDRAVRIMASVQLGRALDDDTTTSIVAFLDSLTGDVPPHYGPPAAPVDQRSRTGVE
jgi:cytochrome c peroxidase